MTSASPPPPAGSPFAHFPIARSPVTADRTTPRAPHRPSRDGAHPSSPTLGHRHGSPLLPDPTVKKSHAITAWACPLRGEDQRDPVEHPQDDLSDNDGSRAGLLEFMQVRDDALRTPGSDRRLQAQNAQGGRPPTSGTTLYRWPASSSASATTNCQAVPNAVHTRSLPVSLDRRDELVELIATGRMQTNEVRRRCYLLPAILLASRRGSPSGRSR